MNILEEEEIKTILLGYSPGKASLINVSLGEKFNENTFTTSSTSFVDKYIIIGNKRYKLQLWDTISQEIFHSLTKIFVKDSKIVILVYDITRRSSFEDIVYWSNTFHDILKDKPIIGVVGNKKDLFMNEEVSEEEARNFAKEIGALFTLVSAKEDPHDFNSFLEDLLIEYLNKIGRDVKDRDIKKLKKKKIGENYYNNNFFS